MVVVEVFGAAVLSMATVMAAAVVMAAAGEVMVVVGIVVGVVVLVAMVVAAPLIARQRQTLGGTLSPACRLCSAVFCKRACFRAGRRHALDECVSDIAPHSSVVQQLGFNICDQDLVSHGSGQSTVHEESGSGLDNCSVCLCSPICHLWPQMSGARELASHVFVLECVAQ